MCPTFCSAAVRWHRRSLTHSDWSGGLPIMQYASELGVEIIKAFEGCMAVIPARPGYYTTYRDSVGVLTVGWGHTNAAGSPHIIPGVVWGAQLCDEVLLSDLARVAARVANIVHLTERQYEFDALISFEYNTGDLAKSWIPEKLASGHIEEALAT